MTYRQKNMPCRIPHQQRSGAWGELIAAAFCYECGALQITWPNFDDGTDFHMFINDRWVTVQVKVAQENLKTGRLYWTQRGEAITADILMLVGRATGKVAIKVLRANTAESA